MGALLRSLVSGILLSAILFSITWAMITGEFPPNPKRVAAGFERLQRLTALSEKMAQAKLGGNLATTSGEDPELAELMGHMQERRKLGDEMLNPPQEERKAPAPKPAPPRPVVAGENSVAAVDELPERDMSVAGVERRLRELELEVDRLKREVRTRGQRRQE